jgi:hypothetical protein
MEVLGMDEAKIKWLEHNGYLPITDAIIREWMKWFYANPIMLGRAEEQRLIYKAKFSYYKLYGKQIVPYSNEYLERSIKEIKRGSRKMFKRYVIYEVWPIKQIHRIYSRWQFGLFWSKW